MGSRNTFLSATSTKNWGSFNKLHNAFEGKCQTFFGVLITIDVENIASVQNLRWKPL